MAKVRDHVSSAISAQLEPFLSAAGFQRYQPKQFVRIRGDLIDCIAFEMSRCGDRKFYMHYYVNLLPDPAMDIHSYQIGNRLHAAPSNDGVPWEGATEESATAAMRSVVSVVQELALPWLDSIAGPRDYIYEYVAGPAKKMESLQLAIALLLAGSTDRPWWICDSLKEMSFYDSPLDDDDEQQMQQAAELQQRTHNGTHGALLMDWKARNIHALRLSDLADH